MKEPFEGYRIAQVPTSEIYRMWVRVVDMLEPAVKRSSGRWKIEDLFRTLCEGQQLLWVAYDQYGNLGVALTTQVIAYPRKKMVCMQFGGGSGLYSWGNEMLDALEKYAESIGAAGIETMARVGFKDFYKKRGYKGSYILFEGMLQRNEE